MRAGIPEFLQTPITSVDLTSAAGRLLSVSQASANRGQVFTVYSAKGGVGTSTVAASLAWALANTGAPTRVALVDFTTTGAGVRVMLNLQPMYDLGSVAERGDRIDGEFLRSLLLEQEPGVNVLAAAEEVDAVEPLDATAATRLIDVLRREYTHVVIDADHHFADQTLAALDAADRILLVSQLDISALRSTIRSLKVCNRLGYPSGKVSIVVNRRAERDPISLADAQQVLQRPVEFRLPNDYEACSGAITAGTFVPRHAATSPFTTAVRQMAGELTGMPFDGGRTGSRLSRLFTRR
jgi:pilus assembly protein CpaE